MVLLWCSPSDVPEPNGDPAAVGGLQVHAKRIDHETFDINIGVQGIRPMLGAVQARLGPTCLRQQLLQRLTVTNSVTPAAAVVAAKASSAAGAGSSRSHRDGPSIPFLEQARLAGGSMPRPSASTLLPALPICGSRNFTWTAEYGRLDAQDACGGYLVSSGVGLSCSMSIL